MLWATIPGIISLLCQSDRGDYIRVQRTTLSVTGKNTAAQPTPSSHLTLLNDMNLLLNLRATACTHQDHWTCLFGRSTLGGLGYIQITILSLVAVSLFAIYTYFITESPISNSSQLRSKMPNAPPRFFWTCDLASPSD
jgi:hypothetical protein